VTTDTCNCTQHPIRIERFPDGSGRATCEHCGATCFLPPGGDDDADPIFTRIGGGVVLILAVAMTTAILIGWLMMRTN
jgi:hypothetical protein